MRTRLYHYRFHVYPVFYPKLTTRGNRERDLQPWVELFVQHVESLLREYPYQWHNFYDFWRDDA